MDLFPFLLDILKYTIAGMGVVWIAFYLLKPYLDKQDKIQMLEFKKSLSQQTLPLRLQAYERVVLYIERINPANMLIRLKGGDHSAAELYAMVVSEVRNEYQHNVTQQLYVSTRAWSVVKQLKDDTLRIINNAVKGLPDDASGLDLSKIILGHLSQLENDPYEGGINLIRKDLDNIL